MTVLELINRIEELSEGTTIYFFDPFGRMVTTDFECRSWRGSYELPAANVEHIERSEDGYPREEVLANLKEVHGTGVLGYKGGEFILDEESTVFLVASGNTSGNAVTVESITDYGCCTLQYNAY